MIECGGSHSLLITTRNLIHSVGDGPASSHGTNGRSYEYAPKLIAALQATIIPFALMIRELFIRLELVGMASWIEIKRLS